MNTYIPSILNSFRVFLFFALLVSIGCATDSGPKVPAEDKAQVEKLENAVLERTEMLEKETEEMKNSIDALLEDM